MVNVGGVFWAGVSRLLGQHTKALQISPRVLAKDDE